MAKYMRCPRSWAASYLDEMPSRMGSALVKGSAVDRAAEENWKQKRTTARDLPLEDVQEIAENCFRDKVDEAGGRDEVDWSNEGFAGALDSVQRLVKVHMRDHAPLHTPVATQLKVSRKLRDGRDLIGYLDAIAEDGTVIDVKSGSRRMSQADADTDLQASAYGWLLQRPIAFDFMRVIDTGRSPAHSEVISTHRGANSLKWFDELANNISTLIDDAVYPTIPGYWCNYCPLQNSCAGALSR